MFNKHANAKRSPCNQGHNHASRAEARRCNVLHLLQAADEIAGLQVDPQYWFTINGSQVKHDNGHRVGYKPDFYYVERGRQVVEDVKPRHQLAQARDYPLRKAIFKALYPSIEFREVRSK